MSDIDTAGEFTVHERTQTKLVLRRFFRHRLAVASMVFFVLIMIFAFAGPLVWQYQYTDITNDLSAAPSPRHPFGTDLIGHDTMAQVMRGILFPSSNIIFNVQTNDPGAPAKPGQVGAGATTSFSWTPVTPIVPGSWPPWPGSMTTVRRRAGWFWRAAAGPSIFKGSAGRKATGVTVPRP